MDKLAYLNQKEEELRRVNEELEVKKEELDKDSESGEEYGEEEAFEEPSEDNEDDQPLNPAEELKEMEADELFLEEEKVKLVTGSNHKGLDSEEEYIENPHIGDDPEEDLEFEANLREISKIERVKDENTELKQTIAYQKAKIEALQMELENSISDCNTKELQIQEFLSKDKTLSDQSKKYTKQINQLNGNMKTYKETNNQYLNKINNLEKAMITLKRDLGKKEQECNKIYNETGNKEVKVNRIVEELEKCKVQLREARQNQNFKSDQYMKESEHLQADNKRLEKQNNELILAFKKQLKLIDILKRQKAHIEAAKLLSFTEDEFVKTLELAEYS